MCTLVCLHLHRDVCMLYMCVHVLSVYVQVCHESAIVLCTSERTCASVQHHVALSCETLRVHDAVSEWCVCGDVYGVVTQGYSMVLNVCMCEYGVGITRQACGMRLVGPVDVCEWYVIE